MASRSVAFLLADLGVTKSRSWPHASNDNLFSESYFETLKYRPEFPDRLYSLAEARSFCTDFYSSYNTEHRHSGIGTHTPLNRCVMRWPLRSKPCPRHCVCADARAVQWRRHPAGHHRAGVPGVGDGRDGPVRHRHLRQLDRRSPLSTVPGHRQRWARRHDLRDADPAPDSLARVTVPR